MFTQQTPFLLSALSPAVGSDTAQQIAQAFGNCNQPLTHRAGVTLQRPGLTTSGGLVNGTGGNSYNYSDGGVGPTGAFLPGNDLATQISPWAVNQNNYYGGDTYNNSLNFAYRSGDTFLSTYPEAASNAFYNQDQSFNFGPNNTTINSPWFTRMGDINTFDFSSRLGDIVNSYAGPTFQVAGDSHFDNSIHNNQTVNNQTVNNQTVDESFVQNLTVENIFRRGGDPGPAGGVGPAGPPGAAGNPGGDGRDALGDVFFGRQRPVFDRISLLGGVGAGPDIDRTRAAFAKPAQCVKSLDNANLAAANIPNNAIKEVSVSLTGEESELPTNAISGCSVSVPGSSVNIPTNAISGCSVTVPGVSVTIPTGVSFDPDTCTVSFTGTTTVYVLASSSVSATVTPTSASTSAAYVLGSSSVAATVTTTPATTATVYTLAAAEVDAEVETEPADTDEYSVFAAGQGQAVVGGVLFTPPQDQALVNARLVGIQEKFARVVIGLV